MAASSPAQAGALPATMPSQGVLQVVPPAALEAALAQQNKDIAANATPLPTSATAALAGYIRGQFEIFKWHRNDAMAGWSNRLLVALRAFNGQYDATKLADIRKFGGSEVYARIIAMKCRGATSLLRDVYLSPDKPWGIKPSEDPSIPAEIVAAIKRLVWTELASMQMQGQQVDPMNVKDRTTQLLEAARDAAKKKAKDQANIAEDKIDEMLQEGGFYKALAEFLVDLPLFPFASIKGPTVKIIQEVSWKTGEAQITQTPKLYWERVSPFDIWWTPGCSDIESASVIERGRITRADLNDLLDLPGYNTDEVRAVLDEYGRGGLVDQWDVTDSERAYLESRENPWTNRSGLLNYLEFHGNVQGRMLLEYGMPEKQIPDELRDYMVQAWLIGTHVIKCQLSPSPRKRHPYFITSFEKVPGTPVGNGLPDILSDIQEVANATLRSLVNNMSIASGPQVVVNDDRLAPNEDGEDLFPWKRWHCNNDVAGNNTQPPISFFQPQSYAQELVGVYEKFSEIADELSAIPKYLAGDQAGGAGRTASGLAMLMGNASKILQTVAANIDRDVLAPALGYLYDLLMLTDESGLLTGEEEVRILGVVVAIQRETQRSRQLEFLQITANPMDANIIGPKGRATVLRSVSRTIGLDGEEIVPSDQELDAQQQMMAQQQQAQQAAQAQGNQPPQASGDMGPRTNLQQKGPQPQGTPTVSGGVQ
jgi:hypothetical protein